MPQGAPQGVDDVVALVRRAAARVAASAAHTPPTPPACAAPEPEPPGERRGRPAKDWSELLARLYDAEQPADLARDYGITRQRVHQIARRDGWTSACTARVVWLRRIAAMQDPIPPTARMEAIAEQRRRRSARNLAIWRMRDGGATLAAIGVALNVSPNTACRVLKRERPPE